MAKINPELQENWNALGPEARSVLRLLGRLSEKGARRELLRCLWAADAGEDASDRFEAAAAEIEGAGAWLATTKAEILKLKSPSRRALRALAEQDGGPCEPGDERLFDLLSGLAYGEMAKAFARLEWKKDPTTPEDATAQIVYLAPRAKGFRYLEAQCAEAARLFMQRDRKRYLTRERRLADALQEAGLPDTFGQALGLHQTSFRAWIQRDEAEGSLEQLPPAPRCDAEALNEITAALEELKPGENVSPFFAAGLHMGAATAWQTDLVNTAKALEVLRAGLPALDKIPAYPESEEYPEIEWGALVKEMYPVAVHTLERQQAVPEAERTYPGRKLGAPPELFPLRYSIGDLLSLDCGDNMYKEYFELGAKNAAEARAYSGGLERAAAEYDPVANIRHFIPIIIDARDAWPGVMEALNSSETPEAFAAALCERPEWFLNLGMGLKGIDLYIAFDRFLEKLEARGFGPDKLPEAGRRMIGDLAHLRAVAELQNLSPENPTPIVLENLRVLPRFGFDAGWLRFIQFVGGEFKDAWNEEAFDDLVEGLNRRIDETRRPGEGDVQPEALKMMVMIYRLPLLLYDFEQPARPEEYREQMKALADRLDQMRAEAKTPRDYFAAASATLHWIEEYGRNADVPSITEQVRRLAEAMKANGAAALAPALLAMHAKLQVEPRRGGAERGRLDESRRRDLNEAVELAAGLAEYYDEALLAPGEAFAPEQQEIRNLALWLFDVDPAAVYGKTGAHDLRDLLLAALWGECYHLLKQAEHNAPGKYEDNAKEKNEIRAHNMEVLRELLARIESKAADAGRDNKPAEVIKQALDFNYGFHLREPA